MSKIDDSGPVSRSRAGLSSRVHLALLLVGISLGPPAALEAPSPTETGALRYGRAYTESFYEGTLDNLWTRFSPELQRAFKNIDSLRAFREQVGREKARASERVLPWLAGATIYHRVGRFSTSTRPVWVQWTFRAEGVATGFVVQPAPKPARTRFDEYHAVADLRLPFRGTWFVYWGGRSAFENYHVVSKSQRFAYDFVKVRDGRTHDVPASRNESYFCFGEPVRAPAPARVVRAVDGIADNPPGVMNEEEPLGNHVVLDHGNHEYSFLAHLQQHSIQVRPGQHVDRGDVLGRCGNSGRSSEAHVHYHLQNTHDHVRGAGLPAQFLSYCAGGKFVTRGEPRRGQTIQPGRRARGS